MLSKHALVVILLLLVAGMSPISSAATTQPGYSISVPGSVDTPQRTFTIEETEYQVSEIASIAPGDKLPVDVTAPKGEIYDVSLYNAEKQIQNVKQGEGSERVTLATTGLSSGTYLLAIYKNDQYKSIYPVVLSKYTVSLDVPSTAQQGETVDVEISTSGSERTPSKVNVVLAGTELNKRSSAVEQSNGEYVATVSLDSVPEGTYSVYASAHGDKEIDGEKEVLGLSDSASIRIQSEPVKNGDSTNQDKSSTESTTESSQGTTAPSKTLTTSPTATSQSVTTLTTTDGTQTTTGSPLTTEPNVITANPSTEMTEETTQSSGQPGFGVLSTLFALFALLFITRQ